MKNICSNHLAVAIRLEAIAIRKNMKEQIKGRKVEFPEFCLLSLPAKPFAASHMISTNHPPSSQPDVATR